MSATISGRGRATGSDRTISATGPRDRTGAAVALPAVATIGEAIAKIGAGCGPGCRKRPLTIIPAAAATPAAVKAHSRGRRSNKRNAAAGRGDGRRPVDRFSPTVRRTLSSGARTVVNHHQRNKQQAAPEWENAFALRAVGLPALERR